MLDARDALQSKKRRATEISAAEGWIVTCGGHPRIERYGEEHRELLARWVTARRKDPADLFAVIPPTGFVVNRRVAGFLYCTDAPLAFLDSFIADPESAAGDRRRDIDTLLVVIRAEAKARGYAAVAGTPSVHTLFERLEHHGFTVVRNCAYAIRRT